MIAQKPPVRREMGGVIGRQPARIVINPSKQYPWYGDIVGATLTGFGNHSVTGGERYTTQQVTKIVALGLDPDATPAMTVRRSASREIYHGSSPPPVYEFECPVLEHQTDGTVIVISPSGDAVDVEADGWVSPPKHRMGRPA